jgi:hypothetical protein
MDKVQAVTDRHQALLDHQSLVLAGAVVQDTVLVAVAVMAVGEVVVVVRELLELLIQAVVGVVVVMVVRMAVVAVQVLLLFPQT